MRDAEEKNSAQRLRGLGASQHADLIANGIRMDLTEDARERWQ